MLKQKVRYIFNLIKLYHIKKISHFWNGNSDKKHCKCIFCNVKKIINCINEQPRISLTGRDSLMLQWCENNLCFEVEVFQDIFETTLLYKDNIIYRHLVSKELIENFVALELKKWF